MKKSTTFALAILMAGLPGIAPGQSLDDNDDDEWNFVIAPYLFLPVATTGTTTVSGFSADLSLDLADVLSNLNFAAAGRFEAWYGDFGGIADLYYTNLGASETLPLPGPGAQQGKVDVTARQGRATLFAAYRFAKGTYTDDNLGYQLEAGAGVQFNLIDQDIDFARIPSLGDEKTWVEPAVMIRGRAEIAENWSFVSRAEFGGFGVGGDTLQWNVVAGLDYQPWEQTSIGFGWTFYGIDYKTGSGRNAFAYDVFQTGPFIAASYRF